MRQPSWNEFLGKYPDDPRGAMEALCRLLFRTKYGIGDSLPYFYNHPGIETAPVKYGSELIGFQSKFFTGETIDDSQAEELIKSIETARRHNASLTKIIVYTNSAFWLPKPDEDAIKRQKKVEKAAKDKSLALEWMFGENILDAVAKNELAYDLFFNNQSNVSHLPKSLALFNEAILQNISSTIHYGQKSIVLDRTAYVNRLKVLLQNGKHVLVSGESGSGKSAIVKQFWEEVKDEEEMVVLFLPASQMNVRSVNEVFRFDEDYTFASFRNFYNGHRVKILVVDSAEKLLDQESTIGSQLLLKGLAEQGWQFVFTCKTNAIQQLKERLSDYAITFDNIVVENLAENEIKELARAYGFLIPSNQKVFQQIRIPFYLARYCEVGDDGLSSIAALREKVWNKKVRGAVRGGEQQRREACLFQIVKEQQQKGTFAVCPAGIDHEAACKLVDEDVLAEHPHRGYSVKHDLYVDWALDFSIEREFDTSASCLSVLSDVPLNLTYANAFSRWLDTIIDQDDSRVNAIVEYLVTGKINPRWEHYVWASIGKSSQYASKFFAKYETALRNESYALFNKFTDVLCVACLEVDQTITYKGEEYQVMRPVGNGWDEAVSFIDRHQDDYYIDHLGLVLKLLSTYSRRGKEAYAMRQAGELSLKLYDEVAKTRRDGEYFWIEKPRPWSELICKYAFPIRDRLNAIFKEVRENKWVKHTDPYAELMAYVLKEANPLSIYTLCLCCYESMTALLPIFWLEHTEYENNDGFYRGRRSGFNREYVFGLNGDYGLDMGYFPESAYQTPIYALLSAEHLIDKEGTKVLKGIIEMMNTCIETYTRRTDAERLLKMTVSLPDGTARDVIASQSLWNLYRGTPNVAMPNLLESMHMAVETFLLELLHDGKDGAEWDYVNKTVWMMLRESKSVSLYSIAASLCVAYPVHFYDVLLFLCQDIRFISFDLTRSISEHHATSIEFAYHRHPSMLEERKKSNKLPHRQRSLENALLGCQLAFDQKDDEASKEKLSKAYSLVDKLRQQKEDRSSEDSTYKFVFERIDYHSMKKEEVDLENGQKGILISPQSTPEMEKERRDLNEMMKDMRAMNLRVWADKKYKGNGKDVPGYPFDKDAHAALEVIRLVEKQVREKKGDMLLLPGDEYVQYIGSAILLMFYKDTLSADEKKECWMRLDEALSAPFAMASNSMSEVKICLAALPAAMGTMPEYEEEYARIIATYVTIKDENVNERLCDMISEVITANDLWHKQPNLMAKALAKVRKELPENDFTLMDELQADSVLCLLTYATDKRELGRICVEKLSRIWVKKDESYSFVNKCHKAQNVAMYMLYAPLDEVSSLVAPYVPLIGQDDYDEPLMTSLLICAAQYGKYDNFWIVWYAFYDRMKERRVWHCQDQVTNEYLLNPRFLMQDYDDWFRLEEKDMPFFERVTEDWVGNPVVLFAFARVFATIGKGLQEKAVGLFARLTSGHPQMKDETTTVVFYLEKIVKRVWANNSDDLKSDAKLKSDYIAVLEFMRDNNSNVAQNFLNCL